MPVEPDTKIEVVIDGKQFSDWNSYEIESDMLVPADAFSLRAPNDSGQLAGKISKFDKCEVYVDGTLQMTGFVDEVATATTPEGSDVTVTGRDAFAFLVDCSATPESIRGLNLKAIAERLTAGWVTTWQADNDENRRKLLGAKRAVGRAEVRGRLAGYVGFSRDEQDLLGQAIDRARANLAAISAQAFPRVKIDPGDRPLDVITRLANRAGMMVWMAADGTGIIARPEYDQDPLYTLRLYAKGHPDARRNNVMTSTVKDCGRDQYSTITMLGTAGNTTGNFAAATKHKASATDSEVTIVRPLILSDGDVEDFSQAKKKAQREVDKRNFEALSIEMKVKGHRNNGFLWEVDQLADVVDQAADIKGVYCVVRRRFAGDEQGRFTYLTLRRSGVYLAS